MGFRLRRSGVVAFVAMLAAGSGVRADPFGGLVDVDSSGAMTIEAETMETWNGCIEHTANMCDTVCDPFGTTDPKGRNCWESTNGSCSGKMGVGLCGTFSFIDFLPVPRANSFSLRHYNTPEDFTFSIFVNGDPWLTSLSIPPSEYKIQTDSGEVTVKEWKDTLFEDVPLDKDVNFIRIQRTGTGIPLIDYITVYPEGVGTAGAVVTRNADRGGLTVHGRTVTCRTPENALVSFDLVDASGRIVRKFVHGERSPGTYRFSLDDYAGRGVYFVRIRAGDVQTLKRLISLQ
mgnify:CR=1 FL=1